MALLCALLAFASFETIIAIVAVTPVSHTVVPPGSSGPPGGSSNHSIIDVLHLTGTPILGYAFPFSIAAWFSVGVVVFQERVRGNKRSRVKSAFAKMGFGSDVFDLMMGMRGAGSRISLMQNMEPPKHRLELSELTGIDWKEVDRQLFVLEKYGFVKVYAQSGTVKLYQVTEQGKLLLNLV